ncbi:nucleotidyltransferase family protein [Nocardioides plantarum]|uniref:Nucleotidyltransferase family protein n=1 Tax=Nocardioides plantarum TaxID=29299 RepID=A0ABV5K6E8_9ACTN|nr:nucleotidyltransferase family protein [Nocardioides plantarum]
MTEAPLTLDEAVPLGYALVLRLAADLGVRALAIKGPVLAAHGLRDPRTSVDIDVLVDPATMPRLQAGLSELGWVDDGVYDIPGIVPAHSVNHHHELWPCELDLHHWFPGFLADPSAVFEVLWARRTSVRVAHTDVAACDEVGAAAVAALHYLRDERRSLQVEELAAVVRRDWSPAQVAELAELAADTGSAETLRPWLELAGATVVPDRVPLVVPLADWSLRSSVTTSEVLPWIVGLRRTPWWRRPAYLWHALWLDDKHYLVWGARDLTGRELLAARWARLRRAGRALPAALRELRRLGR